MSTTLDRVYFRADAKRARLAEAAKRGLETAAKLRALVSSEGLTVEAAADKLGVSKSAAHNFLTASRLDPAALAKLTTGDLSISAAIRIGHITDPSIRQQALEIALSGKTDRGLARAVRRLETNAPNETERAGIEKRAIIAPC
jgi:transcriptional regulator with XRE-family HTH domain